MLARKHQDALKEFKRRLSVMRGDHFLDFKIDFDQQGSGPDDEIDLRLLQRKLVDEALATFPMDKRFSADIRAALHQIREGLDEIDKMASDQEREIIAQAMIARAEMLLRKGADHTKLLQQGGDHVGNG